MQMILAFTILCFSFLLSTVHTFPLVLRDVFNPQITSPNSSATWVVGSTQTVTWVTSNIPANLTNPLGTVLLGQLANGSENLQINNPLAKGFNLTDGQVQITVPNTPPGNNYIIVLMGDSGNASPQFVIAAANPGSSTPSPSPPVPSAPTSSAPGTTITSTSTAVAAVSTPTSPTSSGASPSPTPAGSSTTPPSSLTARSSAGTSSAASSTSTKNSAAWSSSHVDSWKALNICVLSFFIVFLA